MIVGMNEGGVRGGGGDGAGRIWRVLLMRRAMRTESDVGTVVGCGW
jgi:hypothetical protein